MLGVETEETLIALSPVSFCVVDVDLLLVETSSSVCVPISLQDNSCAFSSSLQPLLPRILLDNQSSDFKSKFVFQRYKFMGIWCSG